MEFMLRDVVRPLRLCCFDVSGVGRGRGLLVPPRISQDHDRVRAVLEIRSTSSSIVPGRIVERNTTVNGVARVGPTNAAI